MVVELTAFLHPHLLKYFVKSNKRNDVEVQTKAETKGAWYEIADRFHSYGDSLKMAGKDDGWNVFPWPVMILEERKSMNTSSECKVPE